MYFPGSSAKNLPGVESMRKKPLRFVIGAGGGGGGGGGVGAGGEGAAIGPNGELSPEPQASNMKTAARQQQSAANFLIRKGPFITIPLPRLCIFKRVLGCRFREVLLPELYDLTRSASREMQFLQPVGVVLRVVPAYSRCRFFLTRAARYVTGCSRCEPTQPVR